MANCRNEIIGVQSISLYPNSNIQLIRPDISNENEVNLIANGQGSYTISNPVLLPKWERIVGYSGNYKQNYLDEFTFLANGIENEIPAILKDLRNNRVGYIVEILTTGNQAYVFQSPVFLNNANTKQIDSHSWRVSLSYRIPSFLDKLTLLSTILSNDSQILPTDKEIQGIQRISLYINNNVVFRYLDTSNENEIALVSPVESFITISDINQLPKWERITDNSENYKQNYKDEFSFLLHGIENDVPGIIQSLRNNRLGFIVEILTTGNKPFIFRTPVFLNADNTKQIDSHSWEISLSYRTPSFRDKLILTERPIVEYRNGIVTNAISGETATFDFEAKINSNIQVTFTINWGVQIGTTIINSTLVDGVWKALQTSIEIPLSVDPNQTILVTDNLGDSFEVAYVIEITLPVRRANLVLEALGGSVIDTSRSTNQYNGTLFGSPLPSLTTGINGEINGAYNYIGGNAQYADFGNITDLENIQKLSISIWVKKLTGANLPLGSIVSSGSQGNELQWFVDDKIYGSVRNGASSHRSYLTTTELGNWTHFCLVYDGALSAGNRALLYVNNVPVGTIVINFPTSSDNNGHSFQIARVIGPAFGTGQVAYVHLYDDAISAADVQLLFELKTV